jgi:hypothetical protein
MAALPTPAWAISTGYLIGQYVLNGDNAYQCMESGTSAGSGGPTGTGAGITDGTCLWDYVVSARPTGWDASVSDSETGNNNETVPSQGTVVAALATNAELPSTLLNYLLMQVDRLLLWFTGMFGYKNTWTALQTFSGGLAVENGMTVDVLEPTVIAPPINIVHLSGVLTATNFLLDPNLGSKVGIASIHNPGGNNVSFPATVAGGASAQFPVGGELTIWDQSLTAYTNNVTFTQPASGNGTKVNGSTSIQGLSVDGQVVKFVYLGSSGGYDNWQSMDPTNAD